MTAAQDQVWFLTFEGIGCVVGIVGLIFLIKYAGYTRRLAIAAVEQSEAPQKPCLVMEELPDTTEDAALEAMTSSVLGAVSVRMRNIGHGPALRVHFCFRDLSGAGGAIGKDHNSSCPPIAAGEPGDTHHAIRNLTLKTEFLLDYESLSGTCYRSRAVIEDRRWVRDFTFRRVSGPAPAAD